MDEGLKNLYLLKRKIIEKRFGISLDNPDIQVLSDENGILIFAHNETEQNTNTLYLKMHAFNLSNGKTAKGKVSLDMIRDISSIHGVDITTEVTNMMIYEVS